MTPEPQTHGDWLESAALYAIGAMDDTDRRAFEDHLASCAECQAEVAGMRPVNEALARAVPQLDPPFALRQRVIDSALGPAAPGLRGSGVLPSDTLPASRVGPGAPLSWLASAAALAAAVGLGAYSYSLHGRVTRLEDELATVRVQAMASHEEVEAARVTVTATERHLAVLTAPDSTRVALAGGAPAPRASGRADWSRSRGLAVTTDGLPAAATGRTYQVWLLTSGAPVSAGLLRPDPSGHSTVVYDGLPANVQPTGIALSEEPEGGVAAPTGQIYLVGQIARAAPVK